MSSCRATNANPSAAVAYYQGWRCGSVHMAGFWLERVDNAKIALALVPPEDVSSFRWLEAGLAVAESGLLMNERFNLIMLLRMKVWQSLGF